MEIAELHTFFLKHPQICTDTRKLKEGDLFFALKGDNFDGNRFAKKALEEGAVKAIVDDPEMSNHKDLIQVKDVLTTLQKLASYHRKHLNLPIIAITGSNGKTTTKEIITSVLSKKYHTVATKGNLNNHIGVPLTLLSMNEQTEMGIVEMGANHLHEIERLCEIIQPDYGYITNFGKAHLEGFGGVKGVIQGKSELYRFLIQNDKTIFINANDPIQVEKSKDASCITFAEDESAMFQITLLSATPYLKMAVKKETISSQLIGVYNSKNIGAAICIGLYFKVELPQIKKAIEAYLPNNNRSQIIKKGGNTIILDAYNANPTSMVAALESFENYKKTPKTVILGDMFEVGETSAEEHQQIINLLEKNHFEKAYVCGDHFHQTETKHVVKTKDFEELSALLQKDKIKNQAVLIKGSRGMALERLLEFI